MNDTPVATDERDTSLEDLAAELTAAVYTVVLRRGVSGSWINLELALWRELVETVKKWAGAWHPIRSTDEIEVWQECFLADLSESAFCVTVKYNIRGSLRELGLDMSTALQSVLGHATVPSRTAS
jgi:hypothetical protein